MSKVPAPVLSDIQPLPSAHDLGYILERMGRDKVIQLFASLGIAIRGHQNDIYKQCAFTISWDYNQTKRLRDVYALSEEEGLRLTGFLIEATPSISIARLQSDLRNIVTGQQGRSSSKDDIQGLVDARPDSTGKLYCKYRYRRARVKSSDLSLFHDVPVDTNLWLYDTGLRTRSNNFLYCVAIQPNISSEYQRIRDEFINTLSSIPGCTIKTLGLKEPANPPIDFSWMGFPNCSSSNQFMIKLLEQPVIKDVQIIDVPLIEVFKWDREIEAPELAENSESTSIEEDLEHHIKDMRFTGVSLQNAKTTITTLNKDLHACSTMSINFNPKGSTFIYETELKFKKVRFDGVELKLGRVINKLSPVRSQLIYDYDVYWTFLWEYWNNFIARYVTAVGL